MARGDRPRGQDRGDRSLGSAWPAGTRPLDQYLKQKLEQGTCQTVQRNRNAKLGIERPINNILGVHKFEF